MKELDDYLSEQLQKDILEKKPSEVILNRLQHKMLTNSVNSELRQNAFLPPFTTVFAKKNLAWKISAAAVLLMFFMGVQHINHGCGYVQYADSTQVQVNHDTLNFQLIDSSYIY